MRMRLAILVMISAFVLLSGCAMKGMSLREGIHSFQVQNYRQAFILLKPEADKGQEDAQYAIGYMYYYGQGVVEDRQKAWYWINCAAQKGQADAIVALRILDPNKK
ncbi:MAG: sel1 repeat family protein [Legionellales bacterium]|nr:sel1 repeat family protein [Legionellales bacterium]